MGYPHERSIKLRFICYVLNISNTPIFQSEFSIRNVDNSSKESCFISSTFVFL